MYRRMLVPLDGSKLAEEALPYARELAGRLDMDLDLLHVSRPLETVSLSSMSQFYMDKMAESIGEQIREIQNTTIDQKPVKPVEVRSKVVDGFAVEEIPKYVDENHIDLVLMATHGESGIHRWAMGSTTYQVLHTCKAPVLIIRSGMPQAPVYGKWPEQTILVPLDGSRLAESALPHAEALAKQRGADNTKILLLSVIAPIRDYANFYFPASYPTTVPPNYWDYLQQEIDRAKERCEVYLNDVANKLVSQGITVKTKCVMGEEAEEIIKYANQSPFLLMVIATHGRTGIRHLAFGSIAEKVLLEANVPILLITPGSKSQ